MGDSVVFAFDENRRIVYYKENRDGIIPYNFSSANYSYEETLNERGPFKGCADYGKLTFTVTDEHYNAATVVTEWFWTDGGNFYFAVQQLFCIFATSILRNMLFGVAFIILKNKDKNIL